MERTVVPVAGLLGVVLIATGALGFYTGNPLLVFQVDTIHNIIHAASGVVALICAGISYNAAKWYLIIFGLAYGVVTILGFVNNGDVIGLIQVNTADNYLHLGISAVSLIIGLASPSEE